MPKHTDFQHLIVKLLTIPGADDIVTNHRWPDERERQYELVVSLMTQIISLPDAEIRTLASRLRFLRLLNLSEWTTSGSGDGKQATILETRVRDVLREGGVEEAEAQGTVVILHEVADGIQSQFHGKIQSALREIGDVGIQKLKSALSLNSLSDSQTRRALAFWLQNVANLPVSLEHESTAEFCGIHNIEPADLVQAADEIDLNVAMLDDLIMNWSSASNQDDDGAIESR